jgi:glycosyltransferase involved in cell wall biosynthesis
VLVLSHNFPSVLNPSAGTFVLEQACALQSLGIDIIPVMPTPWPPPFLSFIPHVSKYRLIPGRTHHRQFSVEHPRILVLPRNWLFSCSGFFYYLCSRGAVAKLVREQRIDLIHAHCIMPDGFAAIRLGRELNLPVVCTVHGSDVNIYPGRSLATRWATKWALARVGCLIAVSEHLKTNIFRLVGHRQVEVVRNGADSDVFNPVSKDQARTKLGLPLQQEILVFVGRLVEVKQIPVLLEAMRRLSRSNLHLYLVGDGELKSRLLATAQQLGVVERCSFVGSRSHDEIPLWLSAADCFVLCSSMEGLPTVLPEAMMCGVPIVATAVGGIPEVIKHRETGLLVPTGDAVALAEAIKLLLTDKALAADVASRANTLARVEFTWKANAEKTAEVYRDALRLARNACPDKVTTAATASTDAH